MQGHHVDGSSIPSAEQYAPMGAASPPLLLGPLHHISSPQDHPTSADGGCFSSVLSQPPPHLPSPQDRPTNANGSNVRGGDGPSTPEADEDPPELSWPGCFVWMTLVTLLIALLSQWIVEAIEVRCGVVKQEVCS